MVRVVEAARIRRHVAAAVGDADLQPWEPLQIAVEYQVTHGQRRFQRMADGVGEIMVAHAFDEAGADGMHEDHHVELITPLTFLATVSRA
ncbi:MAG: hypothetical protein OEO77_13465 [Acidimicrobiia bacterium]|nr:hypothetical protein [Acidimicrobiia bacterium]